jgi:predicted dienelactone hydrolase
MIMRALEILTAILLFITWGGYMLPPDKRPRPLVLLPFITVIASMVHIIVEEYRWQMVPIYALGASLFVVSLPQLLGQSKTKTVPMRPVRRVGSWGRMIIIAKIGLGAALLLAAIILPALIPVLKLPEPTGPYQVGTTNYEWVDEARLETFTKASDDHRDLMVRVWYPADNNPSGKSLRSEPELYWPEAQIAGPLLAKSLGMPPFIFDYLTLVKSHSYRKAPLSQALKTYPVLLFSHGYALGVVNQNTAQMEELASHGYIVFSIAHPYESLAVVYPSGRMVHSSSSIWNPFSKAVDRQIQSIWRSIRATNDPEIQAELYRQFLALSPTMQTSLSNWTVDTIFILNEITRINQSQSGDPLAGRLDLERVGLFGHSFGGATAGEALAKDSRFKAAANLDGLQYGDLLDNPIRKPLMMMYSETNPTIRVNDLIYSRSGASYYRLYIKGSTHYNYSDFSFWSPVFKYTGFLGPINGSRMEAIVNRYLLAFFDKHLKGVDSPLLQGPDPSYPEVDFQARHSK